MTSEPSPDGQEIKAKFIETAGSATAIAAVATAALGAFAADLARFQATRPTAASAAFEDFLKAVAPAHEFGFAYSLLRVGDKSQVRLMHRSGWDLTSTLSASPMWWLDLADMLGITLGITMDASPRTAAAQPEPPPPSPIMSALAPLSVVPDPATAPAAESPDPGEFADLIGEGVPDTPVLPEDQEPLSAADRETCLAMIRAIKSAEQRKMFMVAFRSHFNIDMSSKTISPHIVQVQHKKFIQTFIDELELSEVAA